MDLLTTDAYDYALPPELIAERPAARRSDARLLHVSPSENALRDRSVRDLVGLLTPGDLLVVNDARVQPARLHLQRSSGGAVELLILGFDAEGDWSAFSGVVTAMMKSNRSVKEGELLRLATPADSHVHLRLLGRGDGLARLRLEPAPDDPWAWMDEVGRMPLPPYIRKRRQELGTDDLDGFDRDRYQTVYAAAPGAVAAPTAGLHFDEALLEAIDAHGVERAAITLEVGAGTFKPVKTERLSDHAMHSERISVSAETAEAIRAAHERGGRVVAVGTTVVRTLESMAMEDGSVRSGTVDTDLFIWPGYRFRVVDALMTNFHLPRSTLLALVSAFAGYSLTMDAYRHAVASGYRFYSYGDAMFISDRGAE